MNLDNIKFDVNVINDFLYHKVFEMNKVDNEYNKIREKIIDDKKKLNDIIFNKCVIINEVLYHKNRL